jgi:polyisoprenoid-binding protein YceI
MTQTSVAHTWAFEPSHCKIGFSVRHFGISETEGFFHKFEGSIASEKEDFSDASITFSIDVTSVDTQDSQWDAHLKSADFFDAEQFPILFFQSTGMEVVAANQYKMHGITQPVALDVEFGGIVPRDPFGNTKAGFFVEGKLNRKDWGLTWNRALDFGGVAVGETVKIKCNIELIKL